MGAGRLALDIGIVCPQAAGHLGVAAREVLGAAEDYVRPKCGRGEIERRCREAGVVFQPIIFESFGGVSVEAERVLKCLNKAVAVNTDSSEEEVATSGKGWESTFCGVICERFTGGWWDGLEIGGRFSGPHGACKGCRWLGGCSLFWFVLFRPVVV